MNTTLLFTWIIRYGHVAAGAAWLGGYLLLAFILVPALAKGSNERLEHAAYVATRILTYTGTTTIFFGMLLVMRTRGYGVLFKGEWGAIIIVCFVIALTLMGIGDGGLRPAIRRIRDTSNTRPARRLALLGFVLSLLAVGLMTRALYATS